MNRKLNSGSLVRFQLGPTAGLNFSSVGGHMREYWGGGMGVGGYYCPPMQTAPADSDHNYNVINAAEVDPKLGGEPGFVSMASGLHEGGYGLVLDIVPNHQTVRWDLLQRFKRGDHGPHDDDRRDGDNAHWHSDMRGRVFDLDPSTGGWRRFFDIDDLVGVNVEDPDVFRLTHGPLLRLNEQGLIDGVRVDHPGGMRRPCQYLRDLKDAGVQSIIVESVLLGDEMLPAHWPIDGCVGYGFMRRNRGVFMSQNGATALQHRYNDVCHGDPNYGLVAGDFRTCADAAKLWVAKHMLGRELDGLGKLLPYPELVEHLPSALASLGVYRTFVCPVTGFVPPVCRQVINRSGMHHRLKQILLLEDRGADTSSRVRLDEFVGRFQQTSGPVSAIGEENTAFYRYAAVGCNEVGSDPTNHPVTSGELHDFNRKTQQHYPRRFNPISTHDNKWGHYPASRIGALTWMFEQFHDFHARWSKRNQRLRGNGAPDNRLEWQIYQALLGLSPYPIEFFTEWLLKSMREAKIPGQTNWMDQRKDWEVPVLTFTQALFNGPSCTQFRSELDGLLQQLDPLARQIGLGQLVLMLTCPGRPCFYQGDEAWERQSVDPGNRRRQDREGHQRLLARVPRPDSAPDGETDRIVVIKRLNILRAELPQAFGDEGDYTALDEGTNLFTFARGRSQEVVVQVARHPGARKRVLTGYRDLLPELPNHGVFVRRGLTETFAS